MITRLYVYAIKRGPSHLCHILCCPVTYCILVLSAVCRSFLMAFTLVSTQSGKVHKETKRKPSGDNKVYIICCLSYICFLRGIKSR